MLAAIEGPEPVHFYGRTFEYLQVPLEFLEILGRGFADWFGRVMPVSCEEFVALAPELRSRHFMEFARAFGAFTPDAEDDHIETLLRLFRAVAFNTYTPQGMFLGDLLFFRGSSSTFCRSDSGGWETVCEKPREAFLSHARG